MSLLDASDSYFRLKKTSPKLATSVYTDNEFYINGTALSGNLKSIRITPLQYVEQ
jgi:hypothetical protein